MRRIVFLVLVFCSNNLLAADLFVQGGFHFGGDKLVEATFTNGDDESLKAGQLISLSVGLAAGVAEHVETRVMLGVKFDTIDAENGDVDFFRFPVTALGMYQTSEKISLGAGLTYHLNPRISASGLASGLDVDFDNAAGIMLVAEYKLANGGYLGAQYTNIDYEALGATVSGNSIGGILGFRF